MYAFPNKGRAVKKFVAMKLWIARDKDDILRLFYIKPFLNINNEWDSDDNDFVIDEDQFPEVTFENSPQQVEIKLVKEGVTFLNHHYEE